MPWELLVTGISFPCSEPGSSITKIQEMLGTEDALVNIEADDEGHLHEDGQDEVGREGNSRRQQLRCHLA